MTRRASPPFSPWPRRPGAGLAQGASARPSRPIVGSKGEPIGKLTIRSERERHGRAHRRSSPADCAQAGMACTSIKSATARTPASSSSPKAMSTTRSPSMVCSIRMGRTKATCRTSMPMRTARRTPSVEQIDRAHRPARAEGQRRLRARHPCERGRPHEPADRQCRRPRRLRGDQVGGQARTFSTRASRPSASNTLATMPRGVEAGLGVHALGLVVVEEDVGQHHGAHLQAAVERAALGEKLQDVGAEAADRAFLDGDQHLVLAGEPQDRAPRRGAWRSARRRPSSRGRAPRAPRPPSAPRRGACRATGWRRGCPPGRCGPCRSASGTPRSGISTPDALAARVAEGDRAVVIGGGGRHHVDELGLVGRRHHHEARQAAEIGDVEGAGMGRAVGADEAGPVEGEAHRQASGSRRRARPGRRRAAGRSSRWRRTACSPRSPGRPRR